MFDEHHQKKRIYTKLDAMAPLGGGPIVTFKSNKGVLYVSTSKLVHGHANRELIELFPEKQALIENIIKR